MRTLIHKNVSVPQNVADIDPTHNVATAAENVAAVDPSQNVAQKMSIQRRRSLVEVANKQFNSNKPTNYVQNTRRNIVLVFFNIFIQGSTFSSNNTLFFNIAQHFVLPGERWKTIGYVADFEDVAVDTNAAHGGSRRLTARW